MTDDRSKLEVSQGGLKAELPDDVVRQASGFFGRVAGPIAEASDYFGDWIRARRFETGIKTLARAAEIARVNKITINHVPVKFLVPFMEKASLEEEGSGLSEKWACLLAAAAEQFEERYQNYISILAEIGPTSAKALKLVTGGYFENERRILAHPNLATSSHDRLSFRGARRPYQLIARAHAGMAHRRLTSTTESTKGIPEDFFKDLNKELASYAARAYQFQSAEGDGWVTHQIDVSILNPYAVETLERLSLVRTTRFDSFETMRWVIHIVEATDSGIDFVGCCEGLKDRTAA